MRHVWPSVGHVCSLWDMCIPVISFCSLGKEMLKFCQPPKTELLSHLPDMVTFMKTSFSCLPVIVPLVGITGQLAKPNPLRYLDSSNTHVPFINPHVLATVPSAINHSKVRYGTTRYHSSTPEAPPGFFHLILNWLNVSNLHTHPCLWRPQQNGWSGISSCLLPTLMLSHGVL